MGRKVTAQEIKVIETLHGYGLPRKKIAEIIGRSDFVVDGVVTGKRDEWNARSRQRWRDSRAAQTETPETEQIVITDEPNKTTPTTAPAIDRALIEQAISCAEAIADALRELRERMA